MFKRFKQFAAVATVAVVAGLGSAQSASAGIAPEPVTVNLDSLLSGGANEGGITLGDKHYDNFDFSSAGQNPLTAKDVQVVIALDGNQHFVSFLMDLSSIGTARTDLVISYDLHVLDPARHINSVGLSFDGAPLDASEFGPVAAGVIVPTRAAASVTETVSTLDGSDLAPGGPVQSSEIITVFNDGDGADTLPDNLDRTLAVNPTRGLHFVKDILVSSRGEGAALITFVENSVTQNGTAIPLPAAFWAAMPVLGGLVGGKKVRRLFARA